VLSGEATNTNFIVFGLTRSRLELTIYHTRGEHASHYTTDALSTNNQLCIEVSPKIYGPHHELFDRYEIFIAQMDLYPFT
jgi:hypothetical protein